MTEQFEHAQLLHTAAKQESSAMQVHTLISIHI